MRICLHPSWEPTVSLLLDSVVIVQSHAGKTLLDLVLVKKGAIHSWSFRFCHRKEKWLGKDPPPPPRAMMSMKAIVTPGWMDGEKSCMHSGVDLSFSRAWETHVRSDQARISVFAWVPREREGKKFVSFLHCNQRRPENAGATPCKSIIKIKLHKCPGRARSLLQVALA